MGNSFGPYAQGAARSLLILIIMLPFALFGRQKWQKFRWREDKWWFALSLLGSWLISGPLYYAYNHIGIGEGTLAMYAGYLVAMFAFGRLFSGERYTADKLGATVLAVVGLLCTYPPSTSRLILLPFLGALASGLGIGLNMVVSQKLRYSSAQTTVVAWMTSAAANLPMALLLHERMPASFLSLSWLWLLCFVAVALVASWASIHGVKLIEAGTAGILGLLEIVWALVFGLLFFHEQPHLLAYAGAVCIIAAAAIPYRKAGRKTQGVIEEQPV